MQWGHLSVLEALGLVGLVASPESLCGSGTGWAQEPSGADASFSAALACWIVTRIFHGHFAAPKAVTVGGACNFDGIQAVDNRGGPDEP